MLSPSLEAVCTVHQPVEYRVGNGGIADVLVPTLHRHLAGDDGRGAIMAILFPQQKKGHAGLAKLGVDARSVRLRPQRLLGCEGRGEQLAFQRHVVERRRHRLSLPITAAWRSYSSTVQRLTPTMAAIDARYGRRRV